MVGNEKASVPEICEETETHKWPFIDSWSITNTVQHKPCPFMAPELKPLSLQGIVTDHPDHKDTKELVTSSLIYMSMSNHIAVTRSRVYRIGEPSDLYKKWLIEKRGKLPFDIQIGEKPELLQQIMRIQRKRKNDNDV